MKRLGFGASLIALIFFLHAFIYRGFIVDDVFITLRYVQQWTHGNGLVYNIGQRVEGYSNFLWIVLLAPFEYAGFDLISTSKLAGCFLSFLTLIIVTIYARRLESRAIFIPALLLAVSAPFVAWSMSGLETPLFALTTVLALYLFTKDIQALETLTYRSGLSFALVALVRPEGLMFGLFALIMRICLVRFRQCKLTTYDFIALLAWIIPVLFFFLWRFSYYGEWLPNTVYAKSMGLHPRPLLEGVYYIYSIILPLGGVFFIIIPICFLFARSLFDFHHWAELYLLLNIVGYVAFILVGGGDWMPMYRFLVHILPLIYLLVYAGVMRMGEHLSKATPYANKLIYLIIGLQCVFLVLYSLDSHFIQGIGRGNFFVKPDKNIVYMQTHLSFDDTIAVVDAGANAYFMPLTVNVVDMVGLADKHIAHLDPVFTQGIFGKGDAFGRWDVDYVLSHQPDLVQMNRSRQPNEMGIWETNFTGTTLLANDTRFLADYKMVDAEGVHGLFMRKK